MSEGAKSWAFPLLYRLRDDPRSVAIDDLRRLAGLGWYDIPPPVNMTDWQDRVRQELALRCEKPEAGINHANQSLPSRIFVEDIANKISAISQAVMASQEMLRVPETPPERCIELMKAVTARTSDLRNSLDYARLDALAVRYLAAPPGEWAAAMEEETARNSFAVFGSMEKGDAYIAWLADRERKLRTMKSQLPDTCASDDVAPPNPPDNFTGERATPTSLPSAQQNLLDKTIRNETPKTRAFDVYIRGLSGVKIRPLLLLLWQEGKRPKLDSKKALKSLGYQGKDDDNWKRNLARINRKLSVDGWQLLITCPGDLIYLDGTL